MVYQIMVELFVSTTVKLGSYQMVGILVPSMGAPRWCMVL